MKILSKKYVLSVLACLFSIGLYSSCGDSTSTSKSANSDDSTAKSLRFMAYNIHIANPPSQPAGVVDIEAIAKVINDVKPDFVALQEVDRFTNRSGKELDQAKAIANLTGMKYVFSKALDRSNGDYGLAILTKFDIEDSQTFSLPVNPGTGAELRTLGIVRVKLDDGSDLVFGTTHLDHLQDSNRELQTREALKNLEAYQKYPIVLGGDFNMNLSSNVWDLWKTKFHIPCTDCPLTAPAIDPYTTIDFIILNQVAEEKFSVKSYDIYPETYASDHLPVVMEVTSK